MDMDLSNYFTYNKEQFEFIAMHDPYYMKVRKYFKRGDEHCLQLGLLDVHKIELDVLKRYDVWPKLSVNVQKELEGMTAGQRAAVHGLMAKARAGRRNKYPNVPKELVCTTCQCKVNTAPSVLVARVEKLKKIHGPIYSIDDYIKAFQCQKCHPTKGRQANPVTSNLPKEMVCKCGHKVKTNPSTLVKAAAKKNITPEEFVKRYRCQSCEPTRGRHLCGKKRKKLVRA